MVPARLSRGLRLLWFGVLLLRAAAVRPSSYDLRDQLSGRVWPLVRRVEPGGSGTLTVDHDRHSFHAPPACASHAPPAGCHVLQHAFRRYQALFFPHHADVESLSLLQEDMIHALNSSLRRLRKHRADDRQQGRLISTAASATDVEVKDLAAPLDLGVNESYELAVSIQGQMTVSAQTVWGALRGLETLSQLVEYNFTTDSYAIHEIPFRIQDSPSFPHRGLLVDSARHFLPPIRLKRTIEAMSFAKLNVLHWHLTEDESFSMPSSSHPELAEKGAWSAGERYTIRDVQDVVEFAQLRGVRVVPEFDMPGHVSSWSKSHPELFEQACLERSRRLAFKPTKDVFDFLQGLLAEWTTTTFHDQFLHLGSDEVPFECWKGLSISEGGKTYSTPTQLFQHFVGSMFSRAHGQLNRSVIFWDEAFVSARAELPAEAVIQVWRDRATLSRAVQAGHRALLSWGWYLDHLDEDWRGMYDNDPVAEVPEDKREKVLGGEGCMWGETVDGSDQAPTLWPRLAAIAERLWSAPASSSAAAESRLNAFRCLLLRRGVAAAPTQVSGRRAPLGPGSCEQPGGPGLAA